MREEPQENPTFKDAYLMRLGDFTSLHELEEFLSNPPTPRL
jgi:hypothetical protein